MLFMNKWTKTYLCLTGILSAILFACGQDDSANPHQADVIATGNAAFSISLKKNPLTNTAKRTKAFSSCHDIHLVTATIYDSSGAPLKGAEWDCEDGKGTITGIPAGINRIIIVQGVYLDANNNRTVLYRGQKNNIIIEAGSTTDLGLIEASLVDSAPLESVDQDDDGYTPNEGDCNDQDNTIYPFATEIPYDTIDQDCNGEDVTDVDGDKIAQDDGDCNDQDNSIYPFAIEIPYDGIDQDCDGEDLTDVDGDGFDSMEVGGNDPDDNNPDIIPELWVEKKAMPITVGAFGYAVLGDDIYIVGGDNSSAFQRYSTSRNSWDVDTDHDGTLAPLPAQRSFLLCGVIDGHIHAMGGWNENGSYKGDHYIYDPASNSWTTGPSLPSYPIGQFSATVNNKIYVFGGWWGGYRSDVYEYSLTDGWSTKASMPTARNHGTTAVYHDTIYVLAGQGGAGSSLDVVEVYNPLTDSWSSGFSPVPEPLSYLGSSGSPVANDQCFLLGPGDSAYFYDTLTDIWTSLPKMPGDAYGIATIDGTIFAIGPKYTLALEGWDSGSK